MRSIQDLEFCESGGLQRAPWRGIGGLAGEKILEARSCS
jgi:hypothetical protein